MRAHARAARSSSCLDKCHTFSRPISHVAVALSVEMIRKIGEGVYVKSAETTLKTSCIEGLPTLTKNRRNVRSATPPAPKVRTRRCLKRNPEVQGGNVHALSIFDHEMSFIYRPPPPRGAVQMFTKSFFHGNFTINARAAPPILLVHPSFYHMPIQT